MSNIYCLPLLVNIVVQQRTFYYRDYIVYCLNMSLIRAKTLENLNSLNLYGRSRERSPAGYPRNEAKNSW